MTTILPMFPLELVAFPTEQLALHVFEERYKQLFEDCEAQKITFGIPTYTGKDLKFGTEMELVKVVKRYPNGALDVLCNGLRVFELVHFNNITPEKLYGKGEVRFKSNVLKGSPIINKELKRFFKLFYEAIDIDVPVKMDENFTSYTLAHKAGLTQEQEYELLQIFTEDGRAKFLIDYLEIVTITLSTKKRMKEVVALNGHFKHFDAIDFTDFNF